MQKVNTQIAPRNVNGALHQNEGIILQVEDGKQYSFVPLTPLVHIGDGDLRTSGAVTLMEGGHFTDNETGADLFLRKAETPDAYVEIDILVA